MERYDRVFRDPKSPLTPLAPLSTNIFNFEISTATKSPFLTPKGVGRVQHSVKRLLSSSKEQSPIRSRSLQVPKRFSQDFLRVRDVFEKNEPCQKENISPHRYRSANNLKINCTAGQLKYKQASPIPPRALSPQIQKVLKTMGLERYIALFSRQEIDIEVFRMMTIEDIQSLGITNPTELHQLLKAIRLSKDIV